MVAHTFPIFLVYLLLAIFMVHVAAVVEGWYYIIPYIDIPLHVAGGFWVGGSSIWLFSIFKKTPWNILTGVLIGIASALTIGFLWEIFEFYTNKFLAQEAFSPLDTIGDMACDIIGGAFAGWYFSRKPKTRIYG